MEFKKGDRVKLTFKHYSITKEGWTGIFVKYLNPRIDPMYCRVLWDNDRQFHFVGIQYLVSLEPKRTVNDKVKK